MIQDTQLIQTNLGIMNGAGSVTYSGKTYSWTNLTSWFQQFINILGPQGPFALSNDYQPAKTIFGTVSNLFFPELKSVLCKELWGNYEDWNYKKDVIKPMI